MNKEPEKCSCPEHVNEKCLRDKCVNCCYCNRHLCPFNNEENHKRHCMVVPPEERLREWEKEFDLRFTNNWSNDIEFWVNDIKDFIKSLLKSDRERILNEIESELPKWSSMKGTPENLDGFCQAMVMVKNVLQAKRNTK